MSKFLPIAAAVASLLAASVAQADILLIDDFNTPVGVVTVTDTTPLNGITWQSAPGSTALASPNIASSRRIGVESILDNSGGLGGIKGEVGSAIGGRLNFSVDTADNGNGYVEWTIPAFTVTTPATYFFSVVASALGSLPVTGTEQNHVSFSFDGVGANDFTVPTQDIGAYGFNAAGTPINFGLTDTQALYLSGGGTLTLKITGGQGWNLRLDQFAINIPEPTSLALVGLALVGAGVASRRRKA